MTLCVELHQVHRDLANRFLGAFLGLVPGRSTHAAELGRCLACGPVSTEASQLISSDPECAVRVLNDQIVANVARDSEFFHRFEASDAVVAMHNEVAGTHLVGVDRSTGCLASATDVSAGGQGLLAEEFPIGHQGNPPGR